MVLFESLDTTSYSNSLATRPYL